LTLAAVRIAKLVGNHPLITAVESSEAEHWNIEDIARLSTSEWHLDILHYATMRECFPVTQLDGFHQWGERPGHQRLAAVSPIRATVRFPARSAAGMSRPRAQESP